MRRAGRVQASRGLGLAILLALATWGGIEGYGTLRAAALVESLKPANTTGVPALIEQLRSYRRWAGRPLTGLLSRTKHDSVNISVPAWQASPCGPTTAGTGRLPLPASPGVVTRRVAGDLGRLARPPSGNRPAAMDRAT